MNRLAVVNPMTWAIVATLPLSLTLGSTPSVQAQNITAAGDGTGTQVSINGQTYTITGGTSVGPNLFHSFNQFNLDAPEVVHFLSQPQIANILGRIKGGNPSIINGLIQVGGSNANLFLLNPAGIVFGPDAHLNVPADFTATTATGIGFDTDGVFNVLGSNNYNTLVGSPNRFIFAAADLAESSQFSASSSGTSPWGSVVNWAELSVNPGSELNLVGGMVVNGGSIVAPEGQVRLVAVPGGDRVQLHQNGMVLSLEIDSAPIDTGRVSAPEGISPLALPNLLTTSGFDHATDLTVGADGTVLLTGSGLTMMPEMGMALVTGGITAASGQVDVLGTQVGLFGARVNVSGIDGGDGGTIHVGGAFQGANTLPAASVTVVDGASVLTADGSAWNNGGEIIVWAEDTARVYGQLSAIGGTLGGDGGLIETSGKLDLDVNGIDVDASTTHGAAGLWLLDPSDITIAIGGSGSLTGGVFDPGTSDTIEPGIIEAALDSGTNVTLTTSSGTGGSGDITLASPINQKGGGNASLTLTGRLFNRSGESPPTISMNSTGGLTFNLNSINVGTATGADLGQSIQNAHDAIDTVVGTSTINLGAGTFQRGLAIDLSKTLTLNGSLNESGQTVTFLDGGTTSQVVNITSGNVSISNLTIRNGSAIQGAGISHTGPGTSTINNTTISGNNAGSNGGGGIYNSGGALTISNSQISGNQASFEGGGIYNNGGTLTISDSNISSNNAGFMVVVFAITMAY